MVVNLRLVTAGLVVVEAVQVDRPARPVAAMILVAVAEGLAPLRIERTSQP